MCESQSVKSVENSLRQQVEARWPLAVGNASPPIRARSNALEIATWQNALNAQKTFLPKLNKQNTARQNAPA
jgi:hypothetical protein